MANRIKGITVEIGGDTTKLVGGSWIGGFFMRSD